MRYFLALVSISILFSCSSDSVVLSPTAPEHDVWDVLLRRHVSDKGVVDYDGFLADRDLLLQYLDTLSTHHPDPAIWTKEEQLAYWINAYNAFTIELILQHYPLESIKDITAVNIPFVSSPWDIKFFKLGGKKYDLNMIEHDILRTQFNEPRIHFAIVCASKSCPNLQNRAYWPEKVDEQLEAQAIAFINDPSKNEIEANAANLSKIFSWFQGDFTKNGTLVEFINKYADTKLTEDANINYLDYDWQLNN